MKNLNPIRLISFLAPVLLIACFDSPSAPTATADSVAPTGSISTTITLEKTEVLAKRADIGLKKLIVVISSSDKDSLFDTLLVSGNAQTVIPKTYSNLSPEKSWTLAAKSLDLKDSVIHTGSVGFFVEAGQTKAVSLSLTSRFAMLKARYYPVMDSVTRCELLLGAKVVATSSFAKQSRLGDTISLSHDYLPALGSITVKMNVYGTYAGQDMLLYTGSTSLAPNTNTAPLDIKLMYVGPWTPTGKMSMQVSLSAVKTVNANGQLQDKPKGLVAYYPLNGDAKDMSGFGNHGVVTNAIAGKNKYGASNSAMQFDGDSDYIKVASNELPPTTRTMTAMAWIKPDKIVGIYTVFGRYSNFSVVIDNALFGFSYSTYYQGLDGRPIVDFKNAYTTVGTTAGAWTHVAGTYDGSTVRLYVNFKLVASTPAPYGVNVPSTHELAFGENYVDAFKGTLDEVRIYDYALSEKEMTNMSNFYADYKNF